MSQDPTPTTAATAAAPAPNAASGEISASTIHAPPPAPTGAALTNKQASVDHLRQIVEQSADPGDKQLVVREVVPGIVTFSIPFARFATVPIGGRSTAIKLRSGEVLVYVSHPHTSATAEIIAGLGNVKWLVTPDGEHGINFGTYAKAYPDAQKIGVPPQKQKYPDLNWAGIFGQGGEAQKYGFEDEISIHRVSAHQNDELVLHHAPTGTIVEADMLFNLPPTEQYSRAGGLPTLLKLFGSGKTLSPEGSLHDKMASSIAKDKDLLKRELAPIQALKFDRIIPCHGDVIETGGRVAWDKIWAKYA